ncbi:YebG family protein [Motiliproteus sp. SC1-56]|uniref:YebG family protein n=1 Tax=Motiliproteus sp. SC1-56 TaxID=2799565 RepID=UPI001A8C7FDD|nr:YebG family protein [Motiliproteus sp. SC1-56]
MNFQRKTVFIYEINGKEKMRITDPKDAEKWDLIFDTATRLDGILSKKDLGFKLGESERGDLCLFMAQNKHELIEALRGDTPATAGKAAAKQRSNIPEMKVPSSSDGFSL